ncbi:right-handed parallel beta-helix repeat-containing protein [Aeromonas caviae]|uniref:right-handed parallel beta-helix repeat-containing protein n=1 Tax=Aeromonas caviae TaxID=648 RepID=UPI0038D1B481
MSDSNFDGVITPPAAWNDVPQLSPAAVALGGVDGPMNAQALALAARTNLLKEQLFETFNLNVNYGAPWEVGVTATDIRQWFVYGSEVWAPLTVPATLPATPTFAGWVKLSSDGNFRPSQFGAVGNADTSASQVDDTDAFVRGLSYCASVGRNLIPDLDGRRYSVTNIAIPIGIKRFRRFKIKARTQVDQLVYTKGPLFGGFTGIRCDIYGLDLDCNSVARQGFLSNGHEYSEIKKVKAYNIRLVGGSAGIRVATNCNHLDIEKCEVIQQIDPDNGNGTDNLAGVSIIAEVTSQYCGIDSGGAPTYPATITVTDINIEKCVINYGTHGVQIKGLVRGRIRKNKISGSTHRNINISPGGQRLTIACNDLLDAGSSAVNVAWGCKNIAVKGNRINSFVVEAVGSGDDAAIQAYQDVEVLEISGNEISGDWKYAIYCSHIKRATIRDNKIVNGGSLANIMVESTWFQSAPPAGAPYSKQRISTVNASTSCYLVEIYGNEHGGSSAAVALSAFGSRYISEINIHDEMIRGAGRSHYVHIYADALARINSQVSMADIRGSNLSSASNKYSSSFGRSVFNAVSNVVGLEDGLIENGVSGSTPDAFFGPNISFSAASTVTNFINGQNGQIINVRLFPGVVITHNSSLIRLKGSVNVTATSANEILTLKRVQGLWFEICRNF